MRAKEDDMTESGDTIIVRANVTITAASLEAIVENAKAVAGKNGKGMYRVDTADKVSEMISKFLLSQGFENYVKNKDNYTS